MSLVLVSFPIHSFFFIPFTYVITLYLVHKYTLTVSGDIFSVRFGFTVRCVI
jgi:hypothetical protein